jgi:hypothetical protein
VLASRTLVGKYTLIKRETAKVVTAETASSNETCFFLFPKKYFKISFEKIWNKEKEFLPLLSTNKKSYYEFN